MLCYCSSGSISSSRFCYVIVVAEAAEKVAVIIVARKVAVIIVAREVAVVIVARKVAAVGDECRDICFGEHQYLWGT